LRRYIKGKASSVESRAALTAGILRVSGRGFY
jgi:hypothetical protein